MPTDRRWLSRIARPLALPGIAGSEIKVSHFGDLAQAADFS
jgi:hypothetical protein